jgi:hypothetical protein
MGSLDVGLACACTSPANTRWVNDGRDHYPVYVNNARPIPAEEYARRQPDSDEDWPSEWEPPR